jgi:GPH family glycoside/pentoside/hexuronide:cation symporter
MTTQVEKFPLWGKLLYASGNIGFTIADRIWVVFMLYFFLPPAESGMPELISNETFFGVLTVVGVVTLFGRIVDSIADPIVSNWSDRSKSPLGRRRFFLVFGGLPLMVSSVLLFLPPVPYASIANAVWMGFWLSVLLFFFTFYVGPWLALIPELTHTHTERVNMTVLQAAFSMVGVIMVMIGGYALWGFLEKTGMDKSTSLQVTIVILAVIGLVFCYLAIIPINEKRYCDSVPSEIGLMESLKLTLKNKSFILYLVATICMWFALNIISQAATYYVTVLLEKPESFATVVFGAVFGTALVFFPILSFLNRFISKKTIMVISSLIFAVVSPLTYYLGTDVLILDPLVQAYIIFAFLGIPVSVLLAIPNAMISDLAEYDAITTGTRREGMYFGANGLFQKVNLGISTLILGYLFATFGKDVANPLGVKLSGVVVGVVCLIGAIIYIFYPEKDILAVVDKHRAEVVVEE